MLGRERERVGGRRVWEDDGLGIDWLVGTHGPQDVRVSSSLIFDVFG